MPQAITHLDTHEWIDNGPKLQKFLNGAQLGLTAPGTSALIQSNGYGALAVGATSSASGSISVQRYIDPEGTIPQGPALTASLSAGTAGVVNATDGVPFASFTITIAGGTLSNVGLLLQAW